MSCCGGCGHTMGPDGEVRHEARGLCGSCYDRARYTGRLADAPRRTWSRDELLDEWDLLRRDGHTRVQAAERLGIRPGTFERAIIRARAAGDPRAELGVAGGMWKAKAQWGEERGDAHAVAR